MLGPLNSRGLAHLMAPRIGDEAAVPVPRKPLLGRHAGHRGRIVPPDLGMLVTRGRTPGPRLHDYAWSVTRERRSHQADTSEDVCTLGP